MNTKLLFTTEKLLELLNKVTLTPKKHILYNYILAFGEFLGSSQDILINMFDRLGFSVSKERYLKVPIDSRNEGITLREIIYYEFWYYLKYAEPNLKGKKLPPTIKLINLSYDEYQKTFYFMYPKGNYDMEKYQNRLSLVTDYFML